MDVADAAARWARVLRDAWTSGDVDAFVALYTEGAPFQPPFGAPEPAAEHMRRALRLGEPGPEIWVGEPVVTGDRAAVEWWAILLVDGEPRTFAATAWLRFDDAGLVVAEHDYVQSTPGRAEPWPEWGA